MFDMNVVAKNIRKARTRKNMTQLNLADEMGVSYQAVSNWERGLSVPDADLLIRLSEILEVSVSDLLGTNIEEKEADEIKSLSLKLESINLELARKKKQKETAISIVLIGIMGIAAMLFVYLLLAHSPYQHFDYSDPEYAFIGISFHILEWVFIRVFPLLIIIPGILLYLIKRRS